MRIRKFRKEDAKKVSYLIRKTMRHSLIKCYNESVVDELCKANTPARFLERAKDREYYVAAEGSCIIGIMGLKGNEVKTVFVNPRYQGKGIGRALMDVIDAAARKNGMRELEVHSSLVAEEFYRRMGFRKIRIIMSRVGKFKFQDVLMRKRI